MASKKGIRQAKLKQQFGHGFVKCSKMGIAADRQAGKLQS